jgi:hypothetical protein
VNLKINSLKFNSSTPDTSTSATLNSSTESREDFTTVPPLFSHVERALDYLAFEGGLGEGVKLNFEQEEENNGKTQAKRWQRTFVKKDTYCAFNRS